MPNIAFFNNKGGVGKTSLVYHLSCMYADRGVRVLAIDLDPQANLSAMFLAEERLEELLSPAFSRPTILGSVQPIIEGVGDVASVHVETVQIESDDISLVVGDLGLSAFEDRLSESWPKTLDRDLAALRVTTAFARLIEEAAVRVSAEVVLIDVGPNLGAINRAALIASDHVVVPLAPDLFSLQGLRNLGPTLRQWRTGWRRRRMENSSSPLDLPKGDMRPVGYVVLQHAMRLDRPVKAYRPWLDAVPNTFRQSVMDEDGDYTLDDIRSDFYCLGLLKNYRSLMPLAQDSRKPMFFLRVADGALGAQQGAVKECYADFYYIAEGIAQKCGFGPDEFK